MPIIRLAKPEDYVSIGPAQPGMYYIPWEPQMGPGNPTDDPATGVILFNDWQTARAQGRILPTDPHAQLEHIIAWCLEDRDAPGALRIANDIVAVYKDSDCVLGLDFSDDDYPGQAFHYRSELAFLNAPIKACSANLVFKLNCLSRLIYEEHRKGL